MLTDENKLRDCVFRPYPKGKGPIFRLVLWDTGRLDGRYGKHVLGYRLQMADPITALTVILFEGEDYECAPDHPVDSDAAVEGIMGFLTLRPGDTDEDYSVAYTPAQLAYAYEHAEALACEVQARFCDENGNVKEGRHGR